MLLPRKRQAKSPDKYAKLYLASTQRTSHIEILRYAARLICVEQLHRTVSYTPLFLDSHQFRFSLGEGS